MSAANPNHPPNAAESSAAIEPTTAAGPLTATEPWTVAEPAEAAGPLTAAEPAEAAEPAIAPTPAPADRESPISIRAASLAGAAAGAATDAAGTVAATLGSVVRGAGQLAGGARRVIDDRRASRRRRLRELGRQPLAVLWDEHPDADRAARRELGIRQVPVDQIRGTAVSGAQRGGDFLPIRPLRGSNWEGRWRRIRSAMDRLQALPPVDLLKTGDEYWVVDGHNRVAAALDYDQVAIDANVLELLLPGSPRSELPPGPIGAYLAEGMRELRAAGEGRFSPGAGVPQTLAPIVLGVDEPDASPSCSEEAVRPQGCSAGSHSPPDGERPDAPATEP